MDSLSQISVDAELWNLAEQRAEEIICCVQPNRFADQKREEILVFLRNLIGLICGCEIFPFGSMPLRVYLPDGDIDITALIPKSREEDLANKLVFLLESSQHSGVSVCDVQHIRAQVELVKCTINDIAVDISFNQLAGLSTLCFLEKVDQLIGKNHLFKRSVILIKAWCYYESRMVGAHHGLLSTYGLEVLVLYIINLFHPTLNGPLAVFYRFLDYYSTFDWESYAVSISGPVSKSLLSGTVAPEKPGTDGDQLLLSEEFLHTCREMFTVSAGAPDIRAKVFPIKFLNIVDPLKYYNNLGRSVSQGSLYRIRCALNLGLRKLKEMFMDPGERMVQRLENSFVYTLERNGRGQRPDVEVPVSAFGTGKFEVSDLNGDYDKYYGWLLYSQQYHKNIDVLSQPSTPFDPSRQYQGSDVIAPRVPLCYLNSTILPGTAGYSEEMQKSLGTITCIPGVTQLLYGETHSSIDHPSNDAGYPEEMQKSEEKGKYIPSTTRLMYRETHSSINHPFNDAGYSEIMQKPRGTGTFIPSVTRLKYRETQSSVNHPLKDAGISEKMQKSRGTGTYIPSRTQLTYRETHSSITHPSKVAGYPEETRKSRGTGTYIPSMAQPTFRKTHSNVDHCLNETHHIKEAHLSPRHAYLQTRYGTQSSYKEKHRSTHPSDTEMYSTSKEQYLDAGTCSETQKHKKGSGDTEALVESEKYTVDLSLNEFPLLQSMLNTSSKASQSRLPDVHQSEQFPAHLGTTEYGSFRHALSSEPPFLLTDQLPIPSATTSVDSSRSGFSSKNQKRQGLKPKAKPYNSLISNASYSAPDTSSGVSERGIPNTKEKLDLGAKRYH